MSKHYPICAKCKSDSVTMTAKCEWDMDLQEWVADEFYSDGFFCRDCDGDDWEYVVVEEEKDA